jgi:hypothetical protein
VREVVRKSLTDEMMFLQRAKRVLKDGIVRTRLQRVEQLGKRSGFLPSDAQQMFRSIEVERLLRFTQNGFCGFWHVLR